jgi:Fe-S-cluster containining protein
MSDMISPNNLSFESEPTESDVELHGLYAELDAEVAGLGPICRLSGRCCRFQEYGHTLFVSSLEIGYLLSHASEPERPLDRGQTCPWQDTQNRCKAREARPLGCRVYFCDPEYQDPGEDLAERYISRLKRLTEKHGLDWNYAPLHHHLHQERDRGNLIIDLSTD